MRAQNLSDNAEISGSVRHDRALRHGFCLLVALICGAVFFRIGYGALAHVHPAEDAYILFRYAENLAAGHGIVFNIGGPHCEGATDFLWLLLLAGGVRLGGDVALVALAFNALGAGLAGWLLADCCWGGPDRPCWARFLLSAVLPATFLAGGALAGYWGFSSMLYSALILALFTLALKARGRAVLGIPILGLIVALFRPDGVAVGAGFVAVGLWPAWSASRVRSYLAASGACAVAGLGYFFWRWNYFGLLLPLPLYVKQNAVHSNASGISSMFPGLASDWAWFSDYTGPYLIVLGLVVGLIYARFWRDRNLVRLLVFLLPGGALLIILSFAVPTQDIRWRFQAPDYLLLLYSLLYVAGRTIDTRRKIVSSILMVSVVVTTATPPNLAGCLQIAQHLGGAWRSCVEPFAARLGPKMDGATVVALTEAGTVPYWTKAQIVDLVGLNDPEAALKPPTVETLKALDPDMVFLHQGTSLMNDVLIPADADGAPIQKVTPERLGKALRPSRRQIVERVPTNYGEIGIMNVQYAPSVMIKFLSESEDYDIFAVSTRDDRTYLYLFAFKKSWRLHDEALKTLSWSLVPKNYRSYLALKKSDRNPENDPGR